MIILNLQSCIGMYPGISLKNNYWRSTTAVNPITLISDQDRMPDRVLLQGVSR